MTTDTLKSNYWEAITQIQQSVMVSVIAGHYLSDFPSRFSQVSKDAYFDVFNMLLEGVLRALPEEQGEDLAGIARERYGVRAESIVQEKLSNEPPPPISVEPTSELEYDQQQLGTQLATAATTILMSNTPLEEKEATGPLASARAVNQGAVFVLGALDTFMNQLADTALEKRPELANELSEKTSLGTILMIALNPESAESAIEQVQERFRGWFGNKPVADKCAWLLRVLNVPSDWTFSQNDGQRIPPLGDHERVIGGLGQLQAYRAAIVHHGSRLTQRHAELLDAVVGEEIALSSEDLAFIRADVFCLIAAMYASARISLFDSDEKEGLLSIEHYSATEQRTQRWDYRLSTL